MIVGIVNYGRGNVFSVASAVRRTGVQLIIGDDREVIENSDKIILPGVGAFGEAMRQLNSLDLINPLNFHVRDQGKPYLGICVGAQIVAHGSEEFGFHEGLGWINAWVKKLPESGSNSRIPHTGWNDVYFDSSCHLFKGIDKGTLFYYNHSYALHSKDSKTVVGRSDYAGGFDSALNINNIYATLFHPEKSQKAGLKMIENFVNFT